MKPNTLFFRKSMQRNCNRKLSLGPSSWPLLETGRFHIALLNRPPLIAYRMQKRLADPRAFCCSVG